MLKSYTGRGIQAQEPLSLVMTLHLSLVLTLHLSSNVFTV